MMIVIASRKFNPGHLSHLLANYALLDNEGLTPLLLCEPEFSSMLNIDGLRVVYSYDAIDWSKVDTLIVWFPSVTALAEMAWLRFRYNVQIVYVLHEPFESISAYRRAGFSLLKTCKITMTALVNYGLILFSHKIILPSKKAFDAFSSWRISNIKPHSMIPLIFCDEASRDINYSLKRHFSYIGTVAADHAFDEYVKFCIAYFEKNNDMDFSFLIATKSNLSGEVLYRLQPLIDAGVLEIQCGRILSNQEINDCYQSSFLVWNAYRRSMQSGVLPKAYMFGATVLVSESNVSEYICAGESGIVISSDYSFAEISAAISYVLLNLEQMSQSARHEFLNTFDWRSQAKKYLDLMGG